MAVRQTACRYCGQDIENHSPYRAGEWRDRGNNTTCPTLAGDRDGLRHKPYSAKWDQKYSVCSTCLGPMDPKGKAAGAEVCWTCTTGEPAEGAARRTYRVIWEIDVDASSPMEAAREAQAIQRDTESIATVYEVQDRQAAPAIKVFDVDTASGYIHERRIAKAAEMRELLVDIGRWLDAALSRGQINRSTGNRDGDLVSQIRAVLAGE